MEVRGNVKLVWKPAWIWMRLREKKSGREGA